MSSNISQSQASSSTSPIAIDLVKRQRDLNRGKENPREKRPLGRRPETDSRINGELNDDRGGEIVAWCMSDRISFRKDDGSLQVRADVYAGSVNRLN